MPRKKPSLGMKPHLLLPNIYYLYAAGPFVFVLRECQWIRGWVLTAKGKQEWAGGIFKPSKFDPLTFPFSMKWGLNLLYIQ